jgi:hypothetical protein
MDMDMDIDNATELDVLDVRCLLHDFDIYNDCSMISISTTTAFDGMTISISITTAP